MVDLTRVHLARSASGAVVLDDPSSPWLVRVWTDDQGNLRRLHLDMRPGVTGGLTARALRALPLAQITHEARTHTGTGEWPNEALYRMLAAPKPAGARQWDDEHWERVLQVHDWAVSTGRPGGGARAVAQMWGVAIDPTAYRWLATARARLSEG